MSGHGQLYLLRISPEHWGALGRGLQRAMKTASEKSDYPVHGWASWRVGGDLYVLASVRVQLRKGMYAVTPLGYRQAAELVRFLTRGLSSKQDFSSSYSWGEKREKELSDYKLIGFAQAGLEDIRRAAQMLGLEAWRQMIDGQEVVYILAPPEVRSGGDVRAWAQSVWSQLKALLRERAG